MTTKLFKVLNDNGVGRYSSAQWNLPVNGSVGKWMPAIKGPLVICVKGYHLCRPQGLRNWLGPAIYEAEAKGTRIEEIDKIAVRQARLVTKLDTWNERTQRLFAADCAEHVLPIFEKHRPNDSRPRDTIEVARRYTEGNATKTELVAAGVAAEAAAGDAAENAAGDAAGNAAGAAESIWQTERLMGYLYPEAKP